MTAADEAAGAPIPVTVVTGFLGAGKTTLVNHLLRNTQGRRFAVIVNEFAAAGIDGELIASGTEELFEMNNGCVCCSIRGDLVRTLYGLLRRLDGFDAILIETTGLAAPGPVAQTFLIDDGRRSRLTLDSITTVLDARHLRRQIATQPEACEQIAFADQLVLNKIDLVEAGERVLAEAAIRAINPHAPLLPTARGRIGPDRLFGRHGFDLERIEALLAEAADTGPAGHCHDADCDHADHDHHAADHRHSDIGSVLVESAMPMDAGRVSDWLGDYLGRHGTDTLRVKGIVDAAGEDRKLVFQAVHMLLEGDFLGPWPPGPRRSRIVFIGRGLDGPALQAEFDACAATPTAPAEAGERGALP